MYRYLKLFGGGPDVYDARPFRETEWLLEIDDAYEQAVRDAQERASKQ